MSAISTGCLTPVIFKLPMSNFDGRTITLIKTIKLFWPVCWVLGSLQNFPVVARHVFYVL